MQTAFLEAISKGNLHIVKCMQEKGAYVNFLYENKCTPLMKAIETGDVAICRFLIDNGADMHVLYSEYKTSYLMKYLEKKNCNMVKLLVEIGVNFDTAGESGYTPLTKSVEMESFKMVKYFVEQGANVNQLDNNRKTPLSIAASNHYFRIVRFLIDHGADVDLAKRESENYASWNEDFAIYLKSKSTATIESGSFLLACCQIVL
jgi:ankyrin repeat protein